MNPFYQHAIQMGMIRGLTPKQQARLYSYMREGGLIFQDAYDAVLRTDPLNEVIGVRLVSINLPPVRPPRGKKLTRRQRRTS